jgi:hypothetical protein
LVPFSYGIILSVLPDVSNTWNNIRHVKHLVHI